jgi:hypothetical protein
VKDNIAHLLRDEELENYDNTDPAGIHLTLGIVSFLPIRSFYLMLDKRSTKIAS